jgi:hypothetical protein
MAENEKQQEAKKKFAEIREKVAKEIEINPEAKYLLLFKSGTLKEMDLAALRGVWLQAFNIPMIMIVTPDPERDVKVLEIK